jgi:GcrA cell cycle regulator
MHRSINAKFGTLYSRNAAIGRAGRMGLTSAFQPDPVNNTLKNQSRREARAARAKFNPVVVRTQNPEHRAPLRSIPTEPRHLPFSELESGECRYPYGDNASDMTFCGHPKLGEFSYCGPHVALTTKVRSSV